MPQMTLKYVVLRHLLRCANPRITPDRRIRGFPDRPREKVAPMNGILLNYLPLVVFVGVAAAIGLVLLIAPFLVAFQQPDPEKLSAYECGFNAFDDGSTTARLAGRWAISCCAV